MCRVLLRKPANSFGIWQQAGPCSWSQDTSQTGAATDFRFVMNSYCKSFIKLLNIFALFDIPDCGLCYFFFWQNWKEDQDYTAVISWSSLRKPGDSSSACVTGMPLFCKLSPTGQDWKRLCSRVDQNASNSLTTHSSKGFSWTSTKWHRLEEYGSDKKVIQGKGSSFKKLHAIKLRGRKDP